MSERVEPDKLFPQIWAMLGATVELAEKIVGGDQAELIKIIMAGRAGMGTRGERGLMTAMLAVKQGAVAQIDLADAAIAKIEAAAKVASEAALAAPSAGAAN
jgi:hypothetical protein